MEEKIIQIIPAPENLYAVYKDDDEEWIDKVLCLGLTNNGDVVLIDTDVTGFAGIANDTSNFIGIKWNDAK